MTMNGIDLLEQVMLAPELLAAVRAEVLSEQRLAIVKERETLTLRYRVQKRIGAPQQQLDVLLRGLEEIEQAMQELDVIAAEWGAPSS